MRNFRRNSGFTLLEIIIVIAIMGFLVAMIAPRLGGVGADAQANVDNTNLQRLTDTISISITQDSLLPNRLVSIVSYDGAAVYTLPPAGTLSGDFVTRNHLTLHHLDAAEAAALNAMGLTRVLLLDDTTDGAYYEVDVTAGLGVAMIGGGSIAGGGNIVPDAAVANTGVFGDASQIYRMVFGISNDSTLVSSGMISTAPVSPLSSQSEEYTYGHYNIVFPRLAATVARMPATPVTLTITGATTGQVKDINLLDAQESWQFSTISPEGRNWPESDNTQWTITAAV